MEQLKSLSRLASRNGDTVRRVAILGKAPSSLGLAPFHDPSWEIWVLNDMGFDSALPRWDRCYELHNHEFLKARKQGAYWQWLCERHDRPIYMQALHEDIPDCVLYPREEVYRTFPYHYFNNSVSWMIAHFICEVKKAGVKAELGLWGVDMAQHGVNEGSEYAHQRPSCEYWVGMVQGMGIPVHVPAQSELLKCHVQYGFGNCTEWHKKKRARIRELNQRIAEEEQKMTQAQATMHYLRGAREDLNWIERYLPPEDPPE